MFMLNGNWNTSLSHGALPIVRSATSSAPRQRTRCSMSLSLAYGVSSGAMCFVATSANAQSTPTRILIAYHWRIGRPRKESSLLRKLKLPLYAPIEFNAPARLHSLLGAAKSCYPKRKIWDWKGLTLGGMIGFLIAGEIACGLNLFALIPSNYEGTEIPMVALFLTGSAMGSVIVYFMERRKAAAKLIVRAFQRYGIDLDKLCAIADGYPQWIQRVAKDVRMKCLR